MRRSVTAFAILLLVLTSFLAGGNAQAQGTVRKNLRESSYFPVAAGNYWVFERRAFGATTTWRAEVLPDTAPASPLAGAALSGYFPGPPRRVRVWPFDVVSEVQPGGGRDGLWYLMRAPVKTWWTLELAMLPEPIVGTECIDGARLQLVSRDEVVEVPAGRFENVVRIDYQTRCADSGITSEWFAPGVGLVRREESSFPGPVLSELVETNAGGILPVRLPYQTSLALSGPVVVNDLMPPSDPRKLPVLDGRLTVRNDTLVPMALTFSGCRSATVDVHDASGALVLTGRADDGGCCTCTNLLTVTLAGSALNLPFSLKLALPGDAPLADGLYAVTTTLDTTEAPVLRPRATARLEVKSVH
jgi:hypothetical protein